MIEPSQPPPAGPTAPGAQPEAQPPGMTQYLADLLHTSVRLVRIAMAIVVALIVLILVLLLTEPLWNPSKRASWLDARSYTDDLYRFQITQLPGGAAPLYPAEAAEPCMGTAFFTERAAASRYAQGYPRLQVCYLAFTSANPSKELLAHLDARCARAREGLDEGTRDGLVAPVRLGVDRTPGLQAYIRGTASTGEEIKWYVAVVQFENRFYAVEAEARADEWETHWPVFQQAIDHLRFLPGAVRPLAGPPTAAAP